MNNVFASQTNPRDSSLQRLERFLGTLTYGLLAQRKAFVEAQESHLQKCPSASQSFTESFMGDTGFRAITDDILQLVCGKRAELLAERRRMVEPDDLVSKRALHEIPPSTSHLFDEERLSKWFSDPQVKTHRNQRYTRRRTFQEAHSGPSYFKRSRHMVNNKFTPGDFVYSAPKGRFPPVQSNKVKKVILQNQSSKSPKDYQSPSGKRSFTPHQKKARPF